MRQFMLTAALIGSMAGLPALVGCDRTVSETTVEKKGPDGTVTSQEKTTKTPSGAVKTEETTTVDKK